MTVSISEILERGDIATRQELELLWLQYVDPGINKQVLRLISDRELRRMVLIGVCLKNKHRSALPKVIKQMGKALGLCLSTCYTVWREAKEVK
jgi:hypothetical protein